MNVFFLFAGTRERRKCFGHGTFRCPVCGVTGAYERCRSASWAHVYWIPLFKVGQEAEVVVCVACGAVVDPAHVDGGRTGGASSSRRDPNAWTCARCGNVNPAGDEWCLKCGAPGR